MIINQFKKGQGLGNQLWQYASTRCIAKNLNFDFFIKNFDEFKASDFIELENGSGNVKVKNHFYETLYYDHDLDYVGSLYDDKILRIREHTQIHGHFQDEKYLFGNLNNLNGLIKLKQISINTDPNTCILNIRGGEYKKHKKFNLPKSYWINGINFFREKFNVNDFMIVTDDPDYAHYLFPKLYIISGSIRDCYTALYTCQYAILSNSTFSYFPIKTSFTPKKIVAPFLFARFNSSSNRWASPSNFYQDWNWMNSEGNIVDEKKCVKLRDETIRFYCENFKIKMSHDYFMEKNRTLRSRIPLNFKKYPKLILSRLFPMYF